MVYGTARSLSLAVSITNQLWVYVSACMQKRVDEVIHVGASSGVVSLYLPSFSCFVMWRAGYRVGIGRRPYRRTTTQIKKRIVVCFTQLTHYSDLNG